MLSSTSSKDTSAISTKYDVECPLEELLTENHFGQISTVSFSICCLQIEQISSVLDPVIVLFLLFETCLQSCGTFERVLKKQFCF